MTAALAAGGDVDYLSALRLRGRCNGGAHVSVPMYHRTLPQRVGLRGAACDACRRLSFPVTGACPACGALELREVCLSGDATLVTWTRIAPAGAPPEFGEQARRTGGYLVGIVELAEGPGSPVSSSTSPATPAPATLSRRWCAGCTTRRASSAARLQVPAATGALTAGNLRPVVHAGERSAPWWRRTCPIVSATWRRSRRAS